jgi:hypothetical protein
MLVKKLEKELIQEQVQKQPEVYTLFNEVDMEALDGKIVKVKQPIGNFTLEQLEQELGMYQREIVNLQARMQEIQSKIDLIKNIE